MASKRRARSGNSVLYEERYVNWWMKETVFMAAFRLSRPFPLRDIFLEGLAY